MRYAVRQPGKCSLIEISTENTTKGPYYTPDPERYSSLLQSCAKSKALLDGRGAHNLIVENELEQQTHLANLLVSMYGSCGALEDAFAVFLHHSNIITWNFIIKAYADNGVTEGAFQCFEQMHMEGILPNRFVFVSILSLCANIEALVQAKRLHTRILATDLQMDSVIRTMLIHMYGKCGSLENAKSTFIEVSNVEKGVWNAIIAAYIHHGKASEAFLIFDQMMHEGIEPDRVTVLSILSACTKQGGVTEGKSAHNCIINYGLDSDDVVGSALVNMYGKCSSLDDARCVFDKLLYPDVTAWNGMISAYAQNEKGDLALQLSNHMQGKGMLPDKVTFVCILSSCATQGALIRGKQTHASVKTSKFLDDDTCSKALINLYGRCGCFKDAQCVFDNMSTRDISAWNAMIGVCVQREDADTAIKLFHQIQQEGLAPDNITFVSLLTVCAGLVVLAQCKRMHVHVIGSEYVANIVVRTALVSMYGKCNSPEDAHMAFESMATHNLFSWNAVIAAYARKGQACKALPLFLRMQWQGVMPDKITIHSILSLYASQLHLAEGKRIHSYAIACGLEMELLVGNALIIMYVKCDALENARELFEIMPRRDLVTWNAMIVANVQKGFYESALVLFDQLPREGLLPDIVTLSSILSVCTSSDTLTKGKQLHCHIQASGIAADVGAGNALISMYGRCDSIEDALRAFSLMQHRNEVTYISILSACAIQAASEEGKQIHAQIVHAGLDLDIQVGNALINMYGKCGSLDHAERTFNQLWQDDVVSWNSLLAVHSQHGRGEEVLLKLQLMLHRGVVPNGTTFMSILSACSRAGFLKEGWQYLILMKQDYGITPTVDHYNCLLDSMGKAGQIYEAETLIKKLPVKPTVISWMALLCACKNQGYMEVGERVARHLLKMDADQCATYVVLSNMYAESGTMNNTMEFLTVLNC